MHVYLSSQIYAKKKEILHKAFFKNYFIAKTVAMNA